MDEQVNKDSDLYYCATIMCKAPCYLQSHMVYFDIFILTTEKIDNAISGKVIQRI